MGSRIGNLTSRKAIIAYGGILVLLTGVLSAGILSGKQVNAQMPPPPSSNMTQQGGNATSLGKLKALDILTDILQPKVKVKLAQALQTAVSELGPDAQILRAELTVSGDDVVYKVVGLKQGRIYAVTIDPVDGKMLESKNFSLRELHDLAQRGPLDHSMMDTMMAMHGMFGQ
jgi:hypothetical protein